MLVILFFKKNNKYFMEEQRVMYASDSILPTFHWTSFPDSVEFVLVVKICLMGAAFNPRDGLIYFIFSERMICGFLLEKIKFDRISLRQKWILSWSSVHYMNFLCYLRIGDLGHLSLLFF